MRLALQPGGAGLLDRRHRRAGGGAVALEATLGHVQQEGLGGGDPPLDAVLADRHHLAEHGLIGRLRCAVRAGARAGCRSGPCGSGVEAGGLR